MFIFFFIEKFHLFLYIKAIIILAKKNTADIEREKVKRGSGAKSIRKFFFSKKKKYKINKKIKFCIKYIISLLKFKLGHIRAVKTKLCFHKVFPEFSLCKVLHARLDLYVCILGWCPTTMSAFFFSNVRKIKLTNILCRA